MSAALLVASAVALVVGAVAIAHRRYVKRGDERLRDRLRSVSR